MYMQQRPHADATGVLELRGSEELLLIEASTHPFPLMGIGPRGVGVVTWVTNPSSLGNECSLL